MIVGTAGHIDHGKTALVRALTGVDYRELPGIGHFDIIDPRTPAYPVVLAAVRGDSQGRHRSR